MMTQVQVKKLLPKRRIGAEVAVPIERECSGSENAAVIWQLVRVVQEVYFAFIGFLTTHIWEVGTFPDN